jgi:hypothetical protein
MHVTFVEATDGDMRECELIDHTDIRWVPGGNISTTGGVS